MMKSLSEQSVMVEFHGILPTAQQFSTTIEVQGMDQYLELLGSLQKGVTYRCMDVIINPKEFCLMKVQLPEELRKEFFSG